MTVDASTVAATAVIDVHAHLLPPELLTTAAWTGVPDPWRPAGSEQATDGQTGVVPGRWDRILIGDRTTSIVPRALVSLEDRIAAMDAAGVDVQVVSPWMELYPRQLPEASAVRHVSRLNDAMAHEVARASGRLVGMGMAPLTSGAAAEAEVRRAVDELGMCGVIVPASGGGRELDDEDLEPLWAAAADLGAMVMVHPVQPLAAPRMRAHALGDLIGHPLETTTAVATMLRGGVLHRHPGLRLLVPHGGGALPALAERIDSLWSRSGGPALTGPPSAALRRLHYDALTHSDAALRWLGEFADPGRLVLGTDYPFGTGDPGIVDRARRTFTGETLRAVLGSTASALLSGVRHARRP